MHATFHRSLTPARWLRVLLIAFALVTSVPASAEELPGTPTPWHGFDMHRFEVGGRPCRVAKPAHPAPGSPWVWRARFPDYHAEVDRILLERGFHIAYVNTDGMLGSDAALDHWDAFYDALTVRYGLAKRPALEAVSRGGLFAYRWAARHPGRVACIYADTPVCDFKSWPLGSGTGRGSAPTWKQVLTQYGLTQAQAMAWNQNPIDVLAPIAEAALPILHIVSLNDQIVPPAENTFVLAERYRALGGTISLIRVAEGTQPSGGHHFTHPDPVRVADFIELHASITPDSRDYFTLRGTLDRCRHRFEQGGRGKVVFVGGSITNMENGWRRMTADYLRQRFPETDFTFVNAGISSTGSVFGAFRVMHDAFEGGPPDLLFEEAAVNDLHLGHSDAHIRRGMEGILRRVRAASPMTDTVVMHFVDPRHMKDYRDARTPNAIAIHERIAEHYGTPTIQLAREVTERIDAGQFSWKNDFKNLHPSPFGHRLYAASIRRTLAAAWETPLATGSPPRGHVVPGPLDPFSFGSGDLIAPAAVSDREGFDWIERCDPRAGGVGGNVRPGFYDVPMLVAGTPGDRFTLTFKGRGIGLLVAAGSDAGIIDYRIGDGDWRALDLKTAHPQLHLPRICILAEELTTGIEHTLTVRLSADRTPGACRIVHIVVNGE
ncbi:MAG: lysophospholipase L1-like esterase/pimeloyl-ACP methyl ester carboxylesterase [Planctomycetota bacterium]|jgi:sialidase-1